MMIIIMMNTEAVNSKGGKNFRLKSLYFLCKSIQNSIELEKGLLAGERITIFYVNLICAYTQQ